jgi:two-component system, OmpR family, alkaline phosphatase synthesis response regulator PhoP
MNKPGFKILIVDDEPDVVEILSYNLLKENHRIYKAYDGYECLQITSALTPDLILLDMVMPGLNGIETCIELRKNVQLKNIPILFFSGESDYRLPLNAILAGGNHFIYKPARPSAIIEIINTFLK